VRVLGGAGSDAACSYSRMLYVEAIRTHAPEVFRELRDHVRYHWFVDPSPQNALLSEWMYRWRLPEWCRDIAHESLVAWDGRPYMADALRLGRPRSRRAIEVATQSEGKWQQSHSTELEALTEAFVGWAEQLSRFGELTHQSSRSRPPFECHRQSGWRYLERRGPGQKRVPMDQFGILVQRFVLGRSIHRIAGDAGVDRAAVQQLIRRWSGFLGFSESRNTD
jgi:hypothetical protein